MAVQDITFLEGDTAIHPLVNEQLTETKEYSEWPLLPEVVTGNLEITKQSDDDNNDDYKYLIPVYYSKNNSKDILLHIPVLKNYKSYNPKSFEEAVHKHSIPFYQEDVVNIEKLNKYIKENKLVYTDMQHIDITGISKLNFLQLYFVVTFLKTFATIDIEKDSIWVERFK